MVVMHLHADFDPELKRFSDEEDEDPEDDEEDEWLFEWLWLPLDDEDDELWLFTSRPLSPPQDSTSSPSLVHFFVLSPFLMVVTHLHALEDFEPERECFDDDEDEEWLWLLIFEILPL